MEKLRFTTTGCYDPANGFGCASLGLAGVCGSGEDGFAEFPLPLEGVRLTGSYDEILSAAEAAAAGRTVHAAVVLFGNAGGENAFLARLHRLLPCPMVGGGAAIDGPTGRKGLIPGGGEAAVLLITDDRYDYRTEAKCIHDEILGECAVTFDDPRTILTLNGRDAAEFLAEKRRGLGLADTDFEHLTLSDPRGVNAHLSMPDGRIKSGRDVCPSMLLRRVAHEKVYETMRAFYDDENAVVFGCAGLSGLLDRPLETPSVGLFLFGEVCTVDGIPEFGNLMLSKLVITEKQA